MPRKPCFLTKFQTSVGDLACRCGGSSQSLSMRQSSLPGPSRNAFSSSVSVMGGTARSFSQSGWPENSSASKPMVPAFERLLLGRGDLGQDALDLVEERPDQRARARMAGTRQPRQHDHRQPGEQRRAGRTPARRTRRGACPDCQTRMAAARPAAQAHRGACRMASAKAPAMQRAMNTSSAMVCRSSDGAPRALHQIKEFKALTVSKVDVYVNLRPTALMIPPRSLRWAHGYTSDRYFLV